MEFTDWHLYRGTGPDQNRTISKLPETPSWRRFATTRTAPLGSTFKPPEAAVRAVNAALYLRRPLLITGKPGTGKSALAESIAWDLNLGEVLRWPINSRSTVAEGVYRYDAIARLHETQLQKTLDDPNPERLDMGRFLSLGPLGTAFAAEGNPRVLLVDELDKSDIDFPNDLLNLLEDGEYEIPELARLEAGAVNIPTWKGKSKVSIEKGMLKTKQFPIVLFTSNGEREFPPAFLRRCLRLELQPLLTKEGLLEIVESHLGSSVLAKAGPVVDRFLKAQETGDMPNDHLLNAVYLVTRSVSPDATTREELESKVVMRPVSGKDA